VSTASADDLESIFKEQLGAVSEALSALGADFMLIGGLAVGVWGEARSTRDVDMSVRVLAAPDQVRDRLRASGLEVVAGDIPGAMARGEAVRFERRGRNDDPVLVDMLFATTPFEIEALERRTSLRVLGIDLPVATPEDLVIFKVIAGRPRDLEDASALADLHGSAFDWKRIREWCRQFHVESRLVGIDPASRVDR